VSNQSELKMDSPAMDLLDQDTDRFTGVNESGLHPLGHAVLVRNYEPEVKRSIIEIPFEAKGRMSMVEQRCVVIEVGPECWKDEAKPRAKPGDKVLVVKFAGFMSSQTKDGKLYRLVNASDIFCSIEE